MIIDFDDPKSFPTSLEQFDNETEQWIKHSVNLEGVTEGWQITHQLCDLGIDTQPIVKEFVAKNPDIEFAVYHVTTAVCSCFCLLDRRCSAFNFSCWMHSAAV